MNSISSFSFGTYEIDLSEKVPYQAWSGEGYRRDYSLHILDLRLIPEVRDRITLRRAIARGRSIKKITELVEQFGGTTKGSVKKKGWDAMGQEWHWYEHHGIGRVGVKLAGAIDPF